MMCSAGRRVGLRASALALIAATAAFGVARADQVEVSDPPIVKVMESRLAAVTLDYEIVNTGTPKFEAIKLGPITEEVEPFDGDTKYDVVTDDTVIGCGDPLGVGKSCTLKAIFFILDGDPFDSHLTTDDVGSWFADIRVPWASAAVDKDGKPLDSGVAFGVDIIKVSDTPVGGAPEPATWAMLLVGFGVAGAALRRRPRHASGAAA